MSKNKRPEFHRSAASKKPFSVKDGKRGKDAPQIEQIMAKTTNKPNRAGIQAWWKASKEDVAPSLLSSATYIKSNQSYRQRQGTTFSRLYGNQPLYNFMGSSMGALSQSKTLPMDRPTFNIVQSCVDTLQSRITQTRPRPVFLTDNGDYRERNLAKKLNSFIMGEFYQLKAYEAGAMMFRDAAVLGTGCLKVFEKDNRVQIERRLATELYVDLNEAKDGNPRQLFEFALVDRSVLLDVFPDKESEILGSEQAYLDGSSQSSETVSDQVMIVEAWHLPSGENSGDGRHSIVCAGGTLSDEMYDKPKFPFVFLHYTPRMVGFWGQGLAEQLTGNQIEINRLLSTISSSINLVGVPRVFVEESSKVVSAHLNDMIGAIVKYRGVKPEYSVAPCVPAELYDQLQRLINYGYQQSGVSALSASSTKPTGLTSGTAIREYDDIQTDRFAALAKRYDDAFVDLAYLVIDLAKDIAVREGKYETVYPNKNSAKEVDLPKAALKKDSFVIQCFNSSSLPRDPAGRKQAIVELMQAGLITPQEGRRLLAYPDLDQIETLENAAEERIFKALDEIVEDGKYTQPDQWMNLELALESAAQYINLYMASGLEEEKIQQLIDFWTYAKTIGTPPPPPPQMAPANPQAAPQSDLLQNTNQQPMSAPAA